MTVGNEHALLHSTRPRRAPNVRPHPAKLIGVVKCTWRIAEADLDLLETTYGRGKVNAVVRGLIGRACNRLRERGLEREPGGG